MLVTVKWLKMKEQNAVIANLSSRNVRWAVLNQARAVLEELEQALDVDPAKIEEYRTRDWSQTAMAQPLLDYTSYKTRSGARNKLSLFEQYVLVEGYHNLGLVGERRYQAAKKKLADLVHLDLEVTKQTLADKTYLLRFNHAVMYALDNYLNGGNKK